MIRLENVTKSYSADVVAVRDAGFDIAKGEFVFLVGPSGSGKSTLLRMLNRQDRPERGAVWVAGRNIVDMPPGRVPHLRRNIGNIFQDYKLLLEKTVFENVAFAQEVIGHPKHVIKQQVPAVLELVGLAGKEDRLPHQLSGGEQQRVSRGYYAPPRPHQQDRYNRGHGNPRPANRQHNAQTSYSA
jgi:cell division transport system ATP-binding protein